MTATSLYHVGILVDDLDAAIEHFSALLGLHFRPVKTARMEGMTMYGQVETRELTLTCSREGPPHVELIQAHEDGIWGIHHGEGVHHIGGWQEGIDERVAELLGQGHTLDAHVNRPDGTLRAVFLGTEHPHVHNTRFELLVPGPVGGGLWAEDE
jgi:catechol 2,3-dioxygenase-like lactoylglutathione lyase family enzyme